MKSHVIHFIKGEGKATLGNEDKRFIKSCIASALEQRGFSELCEINVVYTNDEGIREINSEQRGIDKPTDVLSFPNFDIAGGEAPTCEAGEKSVFLGDIVISVERARAQAHEYGHSEQREIGYLTVHAVLHLLGYDHESEADKAVMREKEETVMRLLELSR